MDLSEIKELYTEALTLLERIRKHWKEHPHGEQDRLDSVESSLLCRVFSNLYSIMLLAAVAFKEGMISFYQLPIGILLRCCFTDCLLVLYIQRVDKEKAYEELDLRTIEYANSMLERKEVYRDQVKSTGEFFDDDFIDHMWELTMEDNFLGLLALDDNLEEITVTKQSKAQLKETGFSKAKSIGPKDLKDYLIGIPEIEAVVTRLYQYYKYFSQYEHFSESGQGDVMASAEENGNDNIHFPSAVSALSAGVEEVLMYKESRDGTIGSQSLFGVEGSVAD